MQSTTAHGHLLNELNTASKLFDKNDSECYDEILKNLGNARFVLIGEATHGTQEFYYIREQITRRLIAEKGFMAVAIEGDWPDAYQINRYVQGHGGQQDWQEAFAAFKRFPRWMWRNEILPPFIQWLRTYNVNLTNPMNKISFYGLDLYSLYASMEAVITYLQKVDPEGAQEARKRYACFDHLNIDPQTYGHLISLGVKKSCIKEAVQQLLQLQHRAFDYAYRDGFVAEDEYFYAVQNARLVKNAETYYRSMFEGRASTWNIRDTHMADTLDALADHLERKFGAPAKIVVWAHNSHVGDARATEMNDMGEVNIGQLTRERHIADTYLLGFSTYTGTVTAATEWGDPGECKQVNRGLEGSYEQLFHELQYPNFYLRLTGNKSLEHLLNLSRLQRAIGVVYRPETERFSHYFFTHLPSQFDAIIHIDKTTAIKPF